MNEKEIGGISLDDIMAAAMINLDDDEKSKKEDVAVVEKENAPIKTPTNTKPEANVANTQPSFIVNPANKVTTAPVNEPVLTPQDKPKPLPVQDSTNSNITKKIRDSYFIGNAEFVGVKNKLSPENEQIASDIISYIEAEKTAEAMSFAQKLVDKDMSNEIAWLLYGHAKKAWGENQLAERGFKQAIAINPMFANAHGDLGDLYFYNENDEARALDCYKKALELDPQNDYYMSMIVMSMYTVLDDPSESIEKCKEYMETVEDKTILQNTLGVIYVEISKTYVSEFPADYKNPDGEKDCGFVSLEDIQIVKKYCTEAKSLITYDSNKEIFDIAETLLEQCDIDCQLFHSHKKITIIIHTFISAFLLTLTTIGIPFAILAIYVTNLADKFPGYAHNYAHLKGTGDPLDYYKDVFFNEHSSLKNIKDRLDENSSVTTNSKDSMLEDSFWSYFLKIVFKEQIWFIKARFMFYKRFIKEKLAQRKNNETNS